MSSLSPDSGHRPFPPRGAICQFTDLTTASWERNWKHFLVGLRASFPAVSIRRQKRCFAPDENSSLPVGGLAGTLASLSLLVIGKLCRQLHGFCSLRKDPDHLKCCFSLGKEPFQFLRKLGLGREPQVPAPRPLPANPSDMVSLPMTGFQECV